MSIIGRYIFYCIAIFRCSQYELNSIVQKNLDPVLAQILANIGCQCRPNIAHCRTFLYWPNIGTNIEPILLTILGQY